MHRSDPYSSAYNTRVTNVNDSLESMHPHYSAGIRPDRSKKADEKEKTRLARFEANPAPIDHIVFVACHGMTVDNLSSGPVRHKTTFPFETVLASHLGMPVIRYSNDELYNWMCNYYIPDTMAAINTGHNGDYTGEAITQPDGLFDSIFTEGSPKKIRFQRETTADLNLFIAEPDHSSVAPERNPDGIFVFNLDATYTGHDRCKDIAPDILTSVFNDPTHGGKTYIHRADGEYAVQLRGASAPPQPVKLSTLFYVLTKYFGKPDYIGKRIVIMLGSCRSIPEAFYRAVQSSSGTESDGGGKLRRNRVNATRRRRNNVKRARFKVKSVRRCRRRTKNKK